MGNPMIVSAAVSALVALVIGALTLMFNLWRTRRELRNADRRISEEIELELIKQRLVTHHQLMADLRGISSLEIEGKDLAELSDRTVDCLQGHIFGMFGLVASHETRETVIRLRSKCREFIITQADFDKVRKASWEVHQMLRSDLGLSQPNLLSAIDRLRKEELAGTEPQIEALLSKIHHNQWRITP
ncbi:MAG TPA: hypothetical protein VF173_09680 [Thermoanaerobaculia bacterium]|nr:hypothetical protein [Thermoanaerobaculia bacterium]